MSQQRNSSIMVKLGFKLIYEIQARGESYPAILTVCQIGQIFTIIAFFTINSINAWQLLGLNLTAFLDITDFILSIFSLLVMLILITVFLINYHLYNELGTLHKYKGIIDIGNITCTILVYTVQFFYYFLGIYLFWKVSGGHSSNASWSSLLVSFGTPLYLLQSIVFIQKRPYELLSILICPTVVILSMNVAVIVLLATTAVIVWRQVRQFYKLLYYLVGWSCLWCLIESNYGSGQFHLASINLVVIIGCCIAIFYIYPIHASRSTLQDDKMLLHFYKLRKNIEITDRNERQQINIEQEQIYEQYFEQTDFFEMTHLAQQTRRCPFNKWKKQDMQQALWAKIKYDKQNNYSCFDTNLFYFSAGIELKKNVLQLMRQMIDYFQKNRSSYNFCKNYQMYKIAHQVFKSYQQTNANNETLQIADIIQAEQHYHHFYKIIRQLIQQLIDYWNQLIQAKFILDPDIENQLCKIVQLQQQLNQIVTQLDGYPIQQELRLFDIATKFVSNYEPAKDLSFQSKNKMERVNSFESVMLQGDTIERMSLKLLRQLNYQRVDIESHSVRSLIPHNFHLYLQEIYRGFLERGEQTNFMLPLVNSRGCFLLKKCRLYMLPPSDAGVKILLTLEIQKETSQLFLYDSNHQRINLINDGLRQLLSIGSTTLRKMQNGELLFFVSDLFDLALSTEQMNALCNHDLLKAKVIYESFYIKKNHRFNYNSEVTLNLQQQFKFKDCDYKVIAIASQSFKQYKQDELQRYEGLAQNQTKQRNLHQQYANEVFFCKIENPYKSKIVEKVSNIHHRTYRSYFYQVELIKLVLFIIIVVNLVVFRYLNSSLLSQVDTIAQTMYDLNNQYVNLLKLYSNGYSNVLFTRDPNTTKKYLGSTFFSNPPPDSVLNDIIRNITNYYDLQNDKDSQNIKKTYLLYKNLQGHSQLNYQLRFSNFQINTNTQFTNFYDFIVAVEEGFADSSNLPFFVSNYNNILSIMPVYEQYLKFSYDYNSNFSIANQVGFVFMAVVGLLVLYGFFALCKMIELHKDIKRLYNFIDRTDIDKVVQSLTSIKAALDTINHQTENDQRKEQSSRRQLIPKQKNRKQGDSKPEDMQQSVNGCRNNIQNSCRVTIFCPIVIIYTAMILYFESTNMSSDQKDFVNILDLLQKFQINQMAIERNYISLFQSTYYQQLYGPYTNPYQNSTIIKNDFESDGLPDVLEQDISKEENLCQPLYLDSVTIPLFSLNQSYQACASIQSGVLQTGFSQSLEMFQSSIRAQLKAGFNSYLTAKSTMNSLPIIIFTREILTNYLRIKQTNFFWNLSIYKGYSTQQDDLLIGYGLCAGLGILLVLIYNLLHLRRQMTIIINLVCIIPNSAMFSIRMTSFVRKENILEKIDQL